ncbi:EutP/PduV family microcompartment system protein [Bacillus sp. V5-8f]|uniref:EutP/PduV family microcompartment system protein n=1 Tax=Bacillus sp. V5-8f TaxID=2053044 RepID=UPI0015E13675|nr:EutP/PduV family microcompartment system protein [Bacillus sp. V5-8f]
MKNRAMLIGAIRAGKTTLGQVLLGKKVKPRKTQSLIYYDWIVDTPGEYTENPFYYKSIMTTMLEVTHVLFIQDATKKASIFPPGFAAGINKLIIGVVTKCDHENADVDRAVGHLKKAITTGPIVVTSSYTAIGVQELRELVACSSIQEMRDFTKASQPEAVIFHE